MEQNDNSPPAATYRTLELAVAVLTFVFGAVVIGDSWQLGARWGDDGPQAGYFPFYVGLILCISSVVTFWSTWRAHDAGRETFVTRDQLRRIFSMLLPATVFVIAIAFLGIYVSSAAFLAYFMARHGRHPVWLTALVSIGMPVVLFLLFETWFKTPLPKGPLEALFGLL
jgi:putative tricarboxylic transport membrane protein